MLSVTLPNAQKEKPHAILFDFDGVILDTVGLKLDAFLECYSMEDAGRLKAVREYQERHGGIGRRQKFTYFEREIFGRPGDQDSVDALCARFSGIINRSILSAPFIPGAEHVLYRLFGLIPMHLVSGMPDDELKMVLKRRNLDVFFDSIAGSPKEKKVEFQKVLTASMLQPEQVLAVGDSRTEYDAAAELGIPFLAVVADDAPDHFPADLQRIRNLKSFLTAIGFK